MSLERAPNFSGGRPSNARVKGIGIFVALLLAGLGVAVYLVTRPPDRSLDAAAQAWVDEYAAFREETREHIRRALVAISRGDERRGLRLVRELERCTARFARVGAPPPLLEPVAQQVRRACGEVEHAVRVNGEFGVPGWATVALHLGNADDLLSLSRHTLRLRLGEPEPAPA
ncbi:MAG TPA: hypothetical protein VNJ53_12605 [Gaiellaceae bacterium]|nr:hypothetical protein [Gaiellaceae bacterium]